MSQNKTTGKDAAARKREQRERRRAQGLVSIEVWVHPADRAIVRRLEKALREGTDVEATLHATPPAAPKPRGDKRMNAALLQKTLDGMSADNGLAIRATAAGDDMIRVEIDQREEFPIMLIGDEEQLVCQTQLFDETAVRDDAKLDMLETMIEMNVPLPLSSFGRIGNQYILFGALSAKANVEEIANEIGALSDNTLEAIEAMTPFLR